MCSGQGSFKLSQSNITCIVFISGNTPQGYAQSAYTLLISMLVKQHQCSSALTGGQNFQQREAVMGDSLEKKKRKVDKDDSLEHH